MVCSVFGHFILYFATQKIQGITMLDDQYIHVNANTLVLGFIIDKNFPQHLL